jgi:hypothetical protein
MVCPSLSTAREVLPLAVDLDVRLVHPPARANGALVARAAELSFQLRCEFLDPTVDVGMVHLHAPLRHHLFQVSVAERVSQVPAHANQDDFFLEAVAFEVDHVSSGNVTPRAPSLREPTPRPPTQQNRFPSPDIIQSIPLRSEALA